MVWLPLGEKIAKMSLLILAQLTNVTDGQRDGQTPGDSIYRAYAYASRGKNRLDKHWKDMGVYSWLALQLIISKYKYKYKKY